MADLEDMYTLFVDTVARNLDMQVERCAPPRRLLPRPGAVAVGFATRLGTWHDLIAHLGAAEAAPPPAPAARIRTTSRRQRQRRWYPRPHSRRRQPSWRTRQPRWLPRSLPAIYRGARCGIAASPDAAG